MKLYDTTEEKLIRISFGFGKSISFQDTTVKEVFDCFIKVFENYKFTASFEVNNFSPLQKPSTQTALIVSVRKEGKEEGKAKGYKGESKNKTLYCINQDEAFSVFKNNYKKYI